MKSNPSSGKFRAETYWSCLEDATRIQKKHTLKLRDFGHNRGIRYGSEESRRTYFIKKAIKHEGSLTNWAKQHHFMNKSGTIDLGRARGYAKRNKLTHRLRQIALAKRMKKYNR
jgi:hypothetical protein